MTVSPSGVFRAMQGAVGGIVNLLVGAALFALGAWLLYREVMSPPTHNAHIFLAAGLAVLGALVVRPDPIIMGLKQVVVIVGPYIPVIGGKRAGDPPAEPKP